jgi:hypothetical protein
VILFSKRERSCVALSKRLALRPRSTVTATKLTPKQVAQLSGLAASRLAGPEGMALKGSKGGRTTAAKLAASTTYAPLTPAGAG